MGKDTNAQEIDFDSDEKILLGSPPISSGSVKSGF